MKTLKVGDLVKVNDGSWAVRIGEFCGFDIDNTGLSTCDFLIISLDGLFEFRQGFHDIIIKNTENCKIYLHSSKFVSLVSPKTRTVFFHLTQAQENVVSEMINQWGKS